MGVGALNANLWNKKIPLNVMLSVTNRCVSHCSYCNIPIRSQREMTTKEIMGLIDRISKMGCQRLGLWGGEPLMREDLEEIIYYAKRKMLFVTMDSNGYLLSGRKKLVNNLDHLVLALDGDENAHDLNREKGSFQKVMAAIEAVSGRVPLWTITVLTKNNLHTVDFILDKAREYGFWATFQLLHHNEKLSRNHDSLLASDVYYKKVIRKIIEEKKKGAPIASSYNYLHYILNWKDYRIATAPYKVSNLKCFAGRLYCNVDTDGSLYPCSLLVDNMESSNILDIGFERAFELLNRNSCNGCLASCFTEYNYLFSLNISTIFQWLNAFHRTKKIHEK